MTTNEVIVGMHYADQLEAAVLAFELGGYKPTSVTTLAEMEAAVREHPYAAGYYMDINLGQRGGKDPKPALSIYNQVKIRVESGEAIFLAFSGLDAAIQNAHSAGIPDDCLERKPGNIIGFINSLNELK